MDVRINFIVGTDSYIFPLVQSETGSNLTERKDLIIEGIRGDGSIVIPGGKRSQRIRIKGILVGDDYEEITDLMDTMKTSVTNDTATLKLQYLDGTWKDDWSYTVKKVGEIVFTESLRIYSQEYEVEFLVLQY